MKEELADVMIYCLFMADALDVDAEEIIQEELKKNAAKYEVSKAYGSKKKYSEL